MANALLVAEGKGLRFTATDLDLTIDCTIECEVEQPGKLTLPADRLRQVITNLSGEDVSFETDDKNVSKIEQGKSKFVIRGLGAEEFPPIDLKFAEKDANEIEISQETLRRMLDRTKFAISTDESRYVLNGVFMRVHEGMLHLIATDGRRLAVTQTPVEVASTVSREWIVPRSAVELLSKHLTAKGTVTIIAMTNRVAFVLNHENGFTVTIVTKLIEGNYPNWKQAIPTESKISLSVNREILLGCLRRAELMTSDKQNSIKLTLTKNQLELTANSPDVGQAQEIMEVKYKGEKQSIAFNPTYAIAPLVALDLEEVTFSMTGELSPATFTTADGFLYVVMPMRLS